MSIHFFYRKRDLFYSIERVFDNLLDHIVSKYAVNRVYVLYSRVGLPDLLRNILYCLSRSGDINHITGDIYYCMIGLSSKNTVITFHDLGIVVNNSGLKKWFFQIFWYYLPAHKAKYITCISNYTKNELLKYTKCSPDKITVIYNAVASCYTYSPKVKIGEIPIILHIGTRPNKNLERVIGSLVNLNCHLRIIGELTSVQKDLLLNVNINYSNAFNLSDEQMKAEYLSADIISFPSLYEGFGMPIIEAQVIGRVVLTSKIEPLVEISNGSTHLVDPYDEDSIKKGFEVLINSSEYREILINKGRENIKRFDAEFIASQYMRIYDQIAMNHLN